MKTVCIAIILAFSTISINAFAAESYICPMHPHIQGEEGDTCPICGMDLVLFGNNDMDAMANNNMGPDDHSQNAITLSASMIQTIGVRTQKAKTETFGNIIKAVGTFTHNERTEHKITSRANGWIDELGASAVGDEIDAGDLLYKIHSPDIVIAQGDFLRDIKTGRTGRDITSYKVFHHYEMDAKVIQRIKDEKHVIQSIPYYAKNAGTITELNVKKGSYVNLNTVLATMQDLSTLWVNVDISEQDLNHIAKGDAAKIMLRNGEEILTIVDYVHPTINPNTRTGKARLVVSNKDGKLRTNAYANIEITTHQEPRLTVPSSAVLYSSSGARVILALGEGRFAPIDVKTGITSHGKTEITAGINEGDDVVTSSQFLIDSEASLREALSKFSTPKMSGGNHANH